MDIYQRFAFQKGQLDAAEINATEALDKYVIAKVESRKKLQKLIIDKQNYENIIATASDEIAAAAQDKIKKILKTL